MTRGLMKELYQAIFRFKCVMKCRYCCTSIYLISDILVCVRCQYSRAYPFQLSNQLLNFKEILGEHYFTGVDVINFQEGT